MWAPLGGFWLSELSAMRWQVLLGQGEAGMIPDACYWLYRDNTAAF